jgi:hypothetical protein
MNESIERREVARIVLYRYDGEPSLRLTVSTEGFARTLSYEITDRTSNVITIDLHDARQLRDALIYLIGPQTTDAI